MGRAPCCAKVGLKKGKWTAEEDEKLVSYIKANGEGSWRSMPINAGLLRCGKSCRLRWINYLKDDLKRGNISPEEEEIIGRLQASLGNRWSLIATHLVGRTDNEIKNHWNSHLSRKLQLQRCPEIPLPVKKKRGRKPKSVTAGANDGRGKTPSRVRKLKQMSGDNKNADSVDCEKKKNTTDTITGDGNSPVIAPVECSGSPSSGLTSENNGSSGGEFDMGELENMLLLDNFEEMTWNVDDVDYNRIWGNIIDDSFFQPPMEITMNDNNDGDDEYRNLDRWLDPEFYTADSKWIDPEFYTTDG
ncbi:hypothetical protein ZOSMA_80G00270 [Zostera marina]|uniref:Uncharacterized protein n=1 Tax=Zostera marina TaxID=29655 RepID=A0A0K9NMB2_ZOSMR|nr:hypothetical protein ZOSMA_80G00270 [Zostera marina]